MDNVIEIINRKIKEENEFFLNYMEKNPQDSQRKHDHEVILSVYTELLYELNHK